MNRKLSFYRHVCTLLLVAVGLTPFAFAQDFPTRPITFIVPFDAGTSSDQSSRLLASIAEEHLGETIQIVNRPGGGGAVGFTALSNAEPDGYTIGQITVNLLIQDIMGQVPFGHDDLQPINLFLQDWLAISVNADSPWTSMDDLLEDAATRPGDILVGTGSAGTLTNVAAAGIQAQTDTQFTVVPSPGGGAGPATQAAGGHVDVAIGSPLEAQGQADAGHLRILGVSSPDRIQGFDDVPTIEEQGIDFVFGNSRAVFAPSGTPEERVEILTNAFQMAVESERFQEFAQSSGATPRYLDPAATDALLDEQKQVLENYMETIP